MGVPVRAIDDHSRLAYTAMLPDETAASAASFLTQAADWFRRIASPIRRVLTLTNSYTNGADEVFLIPSAFL